MTVCGIKRYTQVQQLQHIDQSEKLICSGKKPQKTCILTDTAVISVQQFHVKGSRRENKIQECMYRGTKNVKYET